MASPLVHSLSGLAIARTSLRARGALVAGAAVASLPDLDLVPGILAGDFARWHHGPSHSLGAAVAVALTLSALGPARVWGRTRTFRLTFLAYGSHVLLDLLTYDAFVRDGVGVPVLWPFSEERFLPRAHLLFFGIGSGARSLAEGLGRVSNLWAVVWEAGLCVLAGSVLVLLRHRGATRSAAVGVAVATGVLLVSSPHLSGNFVEDLALESAPGPALPMLALGPWEAGDSVEPAESFSPYSAGELSAALDVSPRHRSAGSSRAAVSLSPAAIEWIAQHRVLIRETASRFGVPSLALAGVLAAERTLLYDRYDDVVDVLFRAYFATLTEEELRNWVTLQETAYQRQVRSGRDPGLGFVKNPYLWSVGPAQVSFRNVVFYEPRLARLGDRPKRSMREMLRATLSARGSLEYAAVILLDAQEAYARYADLDLRDDPAILATLYHLGSPTRRALRLGEENRRRELRGEAAAVPRPNFYGEFVGRHAAEIASLLR